MAASEPGPVEGTQDSPPAREVIYRHALVVRQADGVRVLDDRSLNGVFVNGERIEWRAPHDGDELLVGR